MGDGPLKSKKAIGTVNSGEIPEVLGTDPGSKNDLPNWGKRSGHDFSGDIEDAGFFRFYIRKDRLIQLMKKMLH